MSYTFKKQLRQGNIGEALFFKAHDGILEKLPPPGPDFRVMGTEDLVEVKTDSWAMEASPNFFFERFSDKAKGSPGGPWQALSKGAKWFCYFYAPNLTYFRFETAALVEHLAAHEGTYKSRDIPNSTYTTYGYLVPRAGVLHLAEQFHFTVSVSGGTWNG